MDINNIQYKVKRKNVSPNYIAEQRDLYEMRPYEKPIQYSNACRYKNSRTLRDEETGKLFHENWTQKFVDYSNQDEYYVVTNVEENRLDIISNMFYNTPRYWWVLALANYIIDPFDIPIGTNIRIPPLISLYNNGGVLS